MCRKYCRCLKTCFASVWVHISTPFIEKTVCIIVWICVWVLLWSLALFLIVSPIRHCHDYFVFIAGLEVRDCPISVFVLLLCYCLSCAFYLSVYTSEAVHRYPKISCQDFYWDCLVFIYQEAQVENWCIGNNESSRPSIRASAPFI